MPDTVPTLSVVIPSHERLNRLPALIREFLEQGADQIVVILDGPHPGWREVLEPVSIAPIVFIEELPANRGLALARTAGLAHATSDVILIADDDVTPCAGAVERHRQFHARHENYALLGYMPVALRAPRGSDQAATYIYARDYENQVSIWRAAGEADSAVLLRSFWGGNASLGRGLYLRAEQFKPSQRLNYNEDLDLGLRLLEIGASAAFDEQAKSWHHHKRGYEDFLLECEVRGEAVADMEVRWPALPDQLRSLVEVPATHGRLAGALQRRIGSRDSPGVIEGIVGIAYKTSGMLRLWKVQDALARFIRRGLAIRGYRLAGTSNDLAV